ncbi:triple tyrosine motif-containing protein [Ekhidna sp.]|uniref:triple tyrosine motif-containing protein n=1 Tax=Ekhidna sp. TaxID=2608089 RepID=UPI003B500DC9
MKLIYLILYFSFCALTSYSQEEKKSDFQLFSLPLVTTYTPTEYEGGIQNWDINQDTSGFVYIANNYGLLEFDGASWKNYPIDGATKTRSVLVQSSTNRIYVGGQKQLGYFERTQSGISYQNLVEYIPDSITKDEIWDINEFNNTLYVNVNGTLTFLDGNVIKPIKGINNIEFVTQFDNELIVGSKSGVFRITKESSEIKLLYNTAGFDYRGAAKVQDGYLLFTYDGKILRYKNEKLEHLHTAYDTYLQASKINKVLSLKNGNIVLGTQNDGLLIINTQLDQILHLTKNKGLNHRTVIALFEDNFNNLWVGLNNGICVIELASPFSLINEYLGLEGTGYAATALNGEVYLGTSSGLFHPTNNDGSFNLVSQYEAIPGSEGLVNNVQAIDDKILLSHHEGAYVFKNNVISKFYDQTGTWGFTKFRENLLIGGTYEGFSLFNDNEGSPIFIDHFNQLSESSRVFEFENDSTLWMTHGYKGVYKIIFQSDTIKRIQHYGENDGFPSDILISVYKISDELIFTAETGIFQYDKEADKFIPHPFLNRWFAGRHLSKIKQLENGDIFYIANGQLGLLKKVSIGVYEPIEKQFKKINDFISDDLENISIINDEEILVGAKEGFIQYKTSRDNQISDLFNTYLRSVSITNNKDSVEIISGTFFNSSKIASTKLIRFEYATPYFDGIDKIRFAYRLKPYEDSWSDWSTTNWKEYTNLPSGDYSFQVKAINIYGNESKINSYNFIIEPKWYETNLAYAAYVSFIMFIFSSVLLVRERKHKVEKIHLNKSKDEVIRSKEREISEFSEKTNQQIQALKNEGLKKEIDHKNSQLASVTMHLLSKNEFVMSLRKKLNDALNDRDNKDSLNRIVKSIDRNIDEDEAWETFAHHFDQVHGNFLHKIKEEVHLTPQETKLCAYLKMNMSTKDIANLMNITIRGVELARYRLRKKLGITRETNLAEYLDSF